MSHFKLSEIGEVSSSRSFGHSIDRDMLGDNNQEAEDSSVLLNSVRQPAISVYKGAFFTQKEVDEFIQTGWISSYHQAEQIEKLTPRSRQLKLNELKNFGQRKSFDQIRASQSAQKNKFGWLKDDIDSSDSDVRRFGEQLEAYSSNNSGEAQQILKQRVEEMKKANKEEFNQNQQYFFQNKVEKDFQARMVDLIGV